MQTGMWQIPQQFECAMTELRKHRPQHVLTVGTWSGWTDAFVNAYLRRFAPDPAGFTQVTFDINALVAPCVGHTLDLLGTKRVVFGASPLVNHGQVDGNRLSCRAAGAHSPNGLCDLSQWLAHGLPGAEPRAVYDLCFIDGDHGYLAAKNDFTALRSRCKIVMFHDIVNKRVGFQNVPRLWKELAGAAVGMPGAQQPRVWPPSDYRYDAHECVYQPKLSDQQMMGIGIITVRSPIPIRSSPIQSGRLPIQRLRSSSPGSSQSASRELVRSPRSIGSHADVSPRSSAPALSPESFPQSCSKAPRLQGKREFFRSFTDGIAAISKAPMSELMAPGYVANAVRNIGLTPTGVMVRSWVLGSRPGACVPPDTHAAAHARAFFRAPLTRARPQWTNTTTGAKESIYGEEAHYKLPRGYSLQTGMWQIPQQFECAMAELRKHRPQHVLTVGTWSGWTDAFVNAYLRRFAPDPAGFTQVTFDINALVAPCVGHTLDLLGAKRVVFGASPLVNHGQVDGKRLSCNSAKVQWPNGVCTLADWLAHGVPGAEPRAVYDLCFIDGNHGYMAAKKDFTALRSRCKIVMLHDIVNKRVGLGAVPRLWKELAGAALEPDAQTPASGWPPGDYRYNAHECVYQPKLSDQQMMGIGIITVQSPIPMGSRLHV
jgi:hypothetical protein